jgi:ankyrin repeat protein
MMDPFVIVKAVAGLIAPLLLAALAFAQTPPSADEISRYTGLHRAAARGDTAEISRLIAQRSDPNAKDGNGRTPLHVAVFGSHAAAARALVKGGANPNALDAQRYDVVTIAAVKDNVDTLRAMLSLGASARNITSPYNGTALIAAAHLGHDVVVEVLIKAGAPLDHVNNLGWTAVMEAIVLGDGGRRHIATLRALVEAGANVNIADRQGATPISHARSRGYREMVAILEKAGAR